MGFKRAFAIIALCTICFFTLKAPNALAKKIKVTASKEALEAAYLYKFLYFITWPPTAKNPDASDDSISICVVGDNPFGDLLSHIEGKTILKGKKRIKICQAGSIKEFESPDICQLLYLALDDREAIKAVLKLVRDLPVVTVSNRKNFLDYGGIIRLLVKDGRLRWEINMKQARRVKLGISSQLLRNAIRVIK